MLTFCWLIKMKAPIYGAFMLSILVRVALRSEALKVTRTLQYPWRHAEFQAVKRTDKYSPVTRGACQLNSF